MKKFLKLFRVKHYLKNVLVLLPVIFGKQLFNWQLWLKILPGLVAFCLLSSAVYILNDVKDREKDRNHPTKRNRPVASGQISVRTAIALALFSLAGAAGLNYLTRAGWRSWLVLGLYFGVNAGYSFGLKNIPVVDICLLVSGFFLRVLYGSVVSEIAISNWMYLTVMSLSFFLGLGKRRNELMLSANSDGGETRGVLKFYNHNFLDKFMYLCLMLTIVFYALWCVDAATVASLGSRLIWTIPLVIAICMKYSLTVEGHSDGDPVNVIFQDKILLVCVFLFCIAFALLIYL